MGNYWTNLRSKVPIVIFILLYQLLPGQSRIYLDFNQITVADGLTSPNYNYYITKDSTGFIWISSIFGLNRYDGQRISHYKSSIPEKGLIADNIQGKLVHAFHHKLWLGTDKTIYYYQANQDRFEKLNTKSDFIPPNQECQVLFLDESESTLWVKANQSLFVLPLPINSIEAPIQPLAELSINHSSKIFKTDIGYQLLIPRNDRLEIAYFSKNKGNLKKDSSLNFLNGINTNAVYAQSKDTIWVGTVQGLICLNPRQGTYTAFNQANRGLTMGPIVDIAPMNKQKFIVATQNEGIFIFDRDHMDLPQKVWSVDLGLAKPFEPNIDKIHLDEDQTLWVSSAGNGIYFANLNKRKFSILPIQNHPNLSNTSGVRGIALDALNQTWAITEFSLGIWDSNGKPLKQYSEQLQSSLPDGLRLFYLFGDSQNRIWVATDLGLFVLNTAQKRFKQVLDNLSPGIKIFTHISETSSGTIIATAPNRGLFRIDKNVNGKGYHTQCIYQVDANLFNLVELPNGTILLEDYNQRLIFLQPSNQELFKVVETIPFQPMVQGYINDNHRNRTWITTDKGLYYLRSNQRKFELVQDGQFLEYNIASGQIDQTGNIWLATNKGIVFYNPDLDSTHIYTQEDGLQSLKFNFGASAQSTSGEIFFGGTKGINRFFPTQVRTLETQANPAITDIEIKGLSSQAIQCEVTKATHFNRIQKLTLPYAHNTLNFKFAALEYSAPQNNKIQYKLIRSSKTVVDSAAGNFARFPDLREGNYQLIVYAYNSDGLKNPKPRILHFTITPPLWRTWWFFIIYAFLVGLIGYLIYRYRIGVFKRREAIKREKEQAKREKAEIETAILRLQMNPHFIYNSMNSIGGLILKKNPDVAYEQLSKFGKLMRKILDFAALPSIPLEEEIEILEEYLLVEKMRFGEKMSHEFDVHAEIDPEELEIPTMILQPFVENAVKHGIAKKVGNGHIQIRFNLDAHSLICEIEDNGIGRVAAQKYEHRKEHVSKAVKITEKRLQLLEQQTNQKTDLTIKDLYDEKGNPLGTLVIITIPRSDL